MHGFGISLWDCDFNCGLTPASWRSVSPCSVEYVPRHPEESVLYRVIAEQLEAFLARQRERDRPARRSWSGNFAPSLIVEFSPEVSCAFVANPVGTIACLLFPVNQGCGARRVGGDAWPTLLHI